MSPPTAWDVLATWWPDPPLLCSLALAGALYAGAVRRLGTRARGAGAGAGAAWPRRRGVAFGAGLAAVGLALQSGLDGFAGELLSIHMVEHLVLVLVAAPLLLAGAPVTLALRAASPPLARRLARILRGPAGRALAHPAVGLAALGGGMAATHLTPLFGLALADPLVHAAEHMLYLLCGLLFWAVLVAPGPPVRRLDGLGQVIYVVLGMPLMSLVGVILVADGAPRYRDYLAPARRLGVSALADQHLAGALMWIAGGLLVGVIALSVAWRSMVVEERRERAREGYRGAAPETAAGGLDRVAGGRPA